MNARRFLAVLLLLAALPLGAQEKTWSIEAGAGIAPIHAMVTRTVNKEMAASGRTLSDTRLSPSITLSVAWQFAPKWEAVLTGSVSWLHAQVLQYGTFGIDPYGNPRYSLQDGAEPAGAINTGFNWSVTAQMRRLWTPKKAIVLYSGLGVGFIPHSSLVTPILPAVIPIGLRYTPCRHLSIFVENTLSPVATLVHGGLGWRF